MPVWFEQPKENVTMNADEGLVSAEMQVRAADAELLGSKEK